jgi:hypothetical protein
MPGKEVVLHSDLAHAEGSVEAPATLVVACLSSAAAEVRELADFVVGRQMTSE